jgi:hypothetical protein
VSDPPTDPEAAAWRGRSADLAVWTWRHLVNRDDVFGAYVHPDRRVRAMPDGTVRVAKSYTAPLPRYRGLARLTPATVARHFAGRSPADVIGLHSTAPDLTCRWGMIEVDKHGDAGDAEVNWRAAEHWFRVLALLGFRAWLSDSNGDGGYHLRIIFDTPVPTGRLYRFLQFVVDDHADVGLAGRPETFPKSPGLNGLGYGNWIRLPGRHHTRDHWSRFWDGRRWLVGADAVAFVLDSRPDPADLLPDLEPAAVTAPPAPASGSSDLTAPRKATTADADRPRMTDVEVALKCLAAIPNGGCHFDTWLRVGLALASVEHSSAMKSAWVNWSAASPKHRSDECDRRWPTFAGRGEGRKATLGTLVYLARQAGHDPYPKKRPKSVAKVRRLQPTTGIAPRLLITTTLPDPVRRPAATGAFAPAPAGNRGVA